MKHPLKTLLNMLFPDMQKNIPLNQNGNDFEVTYEIRVKENDIRFINNISSMEGVKSAIMLSYDGNFTAKSLVY